MRYFWIAAFAIAAPVFAQDNGSLVYERERLVQASDAARYYVFKRVAPKSNIDEVMWGRLSEAERANYTRFVFSLQTLRKIANHPLDPSLATIVETFDGENAVDVLERFEARFYELNGRYPIEFVGVDVNSVILRTDSDMTIR
ncbi:hypothetical protein K3152_08645 [Qipengyuania sp. 1NDH17]|uniref:Uncharacterized protein n=1 Tax=Qipengyuania polymorpha TaxID=2867234 RepID=A0ABS7IXM7_9SPHN|nr:hypothetical protein [Qipengyuania polymorpha]MBX7458311.1 hypothetical protein [Qipengyuania polymorpha]